MKDKIPREFWRLSVVDVEVLAAQDRLNALRAQIVETRMHGTRAPRPKSWWRRNWRHVVFVVMVVVMLTIIRACGGLDLDRGFDGGPRPSPGPARSSVEAV